MAGLREAYEAYAVNEVREMRAVCEMREMREMREMHRSPSVAARVGPAERADDQHPYGMLPWARWCNRPTIVTGRRESR